MKISAHTLYASGKTFKDQTILIEDGNVKDIVPWQADADIVCAFAVPGLIDQHVHGGYGSDVMSSEPEEILQWLQFLLRNGVTQVLAGVYTHPLERIHRALQVVKEVMRLQAGGAGGAKLIGVHLEGPFISTKAPGAMLPDCIFEPTIENYHAVVGEYADLIRLVTLAPEVPGADVLAKYLTGKGIIVEAGHTAATVEQGKAAFAGSIKGITHFFNASTPIRHREPGILTEALLNDSVYCEVICDFVHVHPSAVQLIYRCKGPERMIVISDDIYTSGLPDGAYFNGAETTIVRDGVSRTPEGALAGGSCLMLREVRNLIDVGIPPADAFRMASQTPAEYLGVEGGRILPNHTAEIVCLNHDYEVICTILGTQTVKGEAI